MNTAVAGYTATNTNVTAGSVTNVKGLNSSILSKAITRSVTVKMTWNKDSARTYVYNYLRGLGLTPNILNVNRFGHTVIQTDNRFFYYIFKKEHLHTFNFLFKAYVNKPNSLSGEGESINIEYLTYALHHKATLLYCYEDEERAIFTPSRSKLLNLLALAYPEGAFTELPTIALLKIYCDHHNLVHVQEKTNEYKANDYSDSSILVNERTYCFPYALIEPFTNL